MTLVVWIVLGTWAVFAVLVLALEKAFAREQRAAARARATRDVKERRDRGDLP